MRTFQVPLIPLRASAPSNEDQLGRQESLLEPHYYGTDINIGRECMVSRTQTDDSEKQIASNFRVEEINLSTDSDGFLPVLLFDREDRRHVFEPGSGHVVFVVHKVALGQVFSEYFGFSCQSSFHQLLHDHPHLSSYACME
jgi:hypothetical protein